MYVFPQRVDGYDILKYVFPSMQRYAKQAIDSIQLCKGVKKLILFGSSITLNAGIGSDLDLAVLMKAGSSHDDFMGVFKQLQLGISCSADILNYTEIKNKLLMEQIDKGVILWSQEDSMI